MTPQQIESAAAECAARRIVAALAERTWSEGASDTLALRLFDDLVRKEIDRFTDILKLKCAVVLDSATELARSMKE